MSILMKSIGHYFERLSQEQQERIWSKTEEDLGNSISLSEGLGQKFSLRPEKQEWIWNKALEDQKTLHSISFDIGFNFSYLNRDMQIKALDMAEKDIQFAINLMRGVGYAAISLVEDDIKNRILELAKRNDKLAASLGKSLKKTI